MRKSIERGRAAVKTALLTAGFVYCAADTETVSAAVYSGIQRCINVVVPSLFAMIMVSSILVRSGAGVFAPKLTGRFGRLLFGMDAWELRIFALGMFAGYPAGTKMLCDEYAMGRISKRRAELLAGICFGAGPAFIFGCISRQVFADKRAGQLILVSTVAANVLVALIMSFFLRKTAAPRMKAQKSPGVSADMLTECVMRSGRTMADICIMIIGFSVLTAFLVRTGAMWAAGELFGLLPGLDSVSGEALAASLIEITAVAGASRSGLQLPYVSAAVSFGGVCVFFQLSSITSGKLSIKPLIVMRTAAALMSYWICRILLPLFMGNEAAAAAAVAAGGYSSGTAVPSIMLIIMVVLLMREYGDMRGKGSAYST